MDDWYRVALAILATWRISTWLYYEKGAEGLRGRLCRWPWVARQVCCFWCVTAWAALVCTTILWLYWYALIPLALSGAAILLSGGGRIIWREMVDDG